MSKIKAARPHQVNIEVQAGLARLLDPPKELKKIAAAPCFKPRSNPAGFRECGGRARNNAPRVRLREIRNSESSSPFRAPSRAKNCDRNHRATNESASAIHSEKIPRVEQIIAHPPSPLQQNFSKPDADFRNTLRMLSRRGANRRRTAAEISRATVDYAAAVATREKAAPGESRSGRVAAAVSFRSTSASGKAGADRCDRSIQQCQARRSPLRPCAPAPAAPTPERKRTVLRRKSRAREIFPGAKKSASSETRGGQSSSLRFTAKLDPAIPGRSGEIMRTPNSRAASSINCAMMRELGQP